MGLGKILRVTKANFEQVLKNVIQQNGYDIHFSYTANYYYLIADEPILKQLSLSLS